MPRWGGPSGAKGTRKQREKWEREQRRRWEEEVEQERRFEELASHSDDEHRGVELENYTHPQQRYISDELNFTGLDLAEGRQRYAAQPATDTPSEVEREEDDDYSERTPANMQLALRDKQDQLVQTAMARMQRARLKGRPNVKLTQPELDALLRQQQQLLGAAGASTAITTGRDRGMSGSSQSHEGRVGPAQAISAPTQGAMGRQASAKGKARGKAKVSSEVVPPNPRKSSSSTNLAQRRPSGSRSLSRSGQPPPSRYATLPDARYESARPTTSPSASSLNRLPSQRRAPLPHEADWVPRARSSSSATATRSLPQPSYTSAAADAADFLRYRTSGGIPPPLPAQYRSAARRNVSDTQPTHRRPMPSNPGTNLVRSGSGSGSGGGTRLPGSTSDPTLTGARRQVIVIPDSDSEADFDQSESAESESESAMNSATGNSEDDEESSGSGSDEETSDSDSGVRVKAGPTSSRRPDRSIRPATRPRETVARRRR